MTSMQPGLHIIGDLYECSFENFENATQQSITTLFGGLIDTAGLNRLGEYVHIFGGASFTVVFALGESHVSLHTWPEYKYVSLDIFVCNQSNDNSLKAHNLTKEFIDIFHSQKHNLQTIQRSMFIDK